MASDEAGEGDFVNEAWCREAARLLGELLEVEVTFDGPKPKAVGVRYSFRVPTLSDRVAQLCNSCDAMALIYWYRTGWAHHHIDHHGDRPEFADPTVFANTAYAGMLKRAADGKGLELPRRAEA